MNLLFFYIAVNNTKSQETWIIKVHKMLKWKKKEDNQQWFMEGALFRGLTGGFDFGLVLFRGAFPSVMTGSGLEPERSILLLRPRISLGRYALDFISVHTHNMHITIIIDLCSFLCIIITKGWKLEWSNYFERMYNYYNLESTNQLKDTFLQICWLDHTLQITVTLPWENQHNFGHFTPHCCH